MMSSIIFYTLCFSSQPADADSDLCLLVVDVNQSSADCSVRLHHQSGKEAFVIFVNKRTSCIHTLNGPFFTLSAALSL